MSSRPGTARRDTGQGVGPCTHTEQAGESLKGQTIENYKGNLLEV